MDTKLFPHIKYVMDKFKGKLPKDDLKRFAKEVRSFPCKCQEAFAYLRGTKISKKLVSSDFKNHRVEDPTKISSRQEKQVKKYVKEYFDKAVAKKREHDKKKAERRSKEGESAVSPTSATFPNVKVEEESDGDQDVAMSEADEKEKPKLESVTPMTPSDQLLQAERLKRKRVNDENPDSIMLEDNEATPSKRLKSESPPPPPPPPPADGSPPDSMSFSREEIEDDHQNSHATNRSLDDSGSIELSPESYGYSMSQPPTSKKTKSAITEGVSSHAHASDASIEYDEHERLFGGNGQRHLSDIEVHGAA